MQKDKNRKTTDEHYGGKPCLISSGIIRLLLGRMAGLAEGKTGAG